MQRLLPHRVVWNAKKAGYEVQDVHPIIFEWPALFLTQPGKPPGLTGFRRFTFKGSMGASLEGKEIRVRGGVYWIASQRKKSKLRKQYIGPPMAVTIARLEEVAQILAAKA